MIRLVRLPHCAQQSAAHIRVTPEQEAYSGSVTDAFASDPERCDLHGIEADGALVGLFKIDRAYHFSVPWHPRDMLGLRAFMIDRDRQGAGLASAALGGLSAYLAQSYPDRRAVTLSVDAVNAAAVHCYLKGGFRDTGQVIEDGPLGAQMVLRMDLGA